MWSPPFTAGPAQVLTGGEAQNNAAVSDPGSETQAAASGQTSDDRAAATQSTRANDDPVAAAGSRREDSGNGQESEKPATPAHTGVHALLFGLLEDVKNLPSKENAIIAGVGGGVALAVHPYDQTFNVKLRSHYDEVNDTFYVGKYLGNSPEQMAMAFATWLYGRVAQEPKVSHLGMDLLRAQILTEGLTEAIKFATHRERPDGSNAQSFPSGHASVTFASATVIERHLGWKYSVFGYAAATYVAASRLHDNRHYLSDVAFGAALGTLAGRTVVGGHGRNTWTMAPVTFPGGAAIIVARVAR